MGKEKSDNSTINQAEKPSWAIRLIGLIVIAIIVFVIVFSVLALIGPSVGNVFSDLAPSL